MERTWFFRIITAICMWSNIQILFGDTPIYAGVGYILGGITVWILGLKWNDEPAKIIIDKQTGQNSQVKNEHSLFKIKMQYWAFIVSIIGIVIIVSELF